MSISQSFSFRKCRASVDCVLYMRARTGYNGAAMNKAFLVSLALSCVASPLFAGQPIESLPQLLEQTVPASADAVVSRRGSAFSALASLPADTDSFLAVQNLGKLGTLTEAAGPYEPMLRMAAALDSFALGVSRDAAEDLQRLWPLFALLGEEMSYLDAWVAQARPEAARAIVAVQRITQEERGARLVELTRNFRLAPIYMVLTAKPEGRTLLQQASLLPLMIPVAPGGPVELTAQGAWRGLCFKGHLLDLREADLAPEHEQQLKANLENLRIYVMTRVVGGRLQLVVTSDMALVKLPDKAQDSLLYSDRMVPFDSCMSGTPWAVSHTSPELVSLSTSLDMSAYSGVARMVGRVMQQLGSQNETCARAATAIEALLRQAETLTQPVKHAEQLMVWQDDAWYVRAVSDARGMEFLPGTLGYQSLSRAQDTIFVAETTPASITGCELPELPELFEQLVEVLQGCRETLQPEHAAGVEEQLQMLAELRPAAEKVAVDALKLGTSLTGDAALLVQQLPAGAEHPVRFSLRAGVADAAGVESVLPSLGGVTDKLCAADCPFAVQHDAHALLLTSSAGGALSLDAPSKTVQVQGGAVFSLQLAPLCNSLQQAAAACPEPELREAAAVVEAVADAVERVDAAATTRDGKLHLLMRLQPVVD